MGQYSVLFREGRQGHEGMGATRAVRCPPPKQQCSGEPEWEPASLHALALRGLLPLALWETLRGLEPGLLSWF